MIKLTGTIVAAIMVVTTAPQAVGAQESDPVVTECNQECIDWVTAVNAVRWFRHFHPFLVCTRDIESDGNYSVVSRSGRYRGAYQFAQLTWNSTARHAGAFELVGVDPAKASRFDQDAMAEVLMRWQGSGPWLRRCSQHL